MNGASLTDLAGTVESTQEQYDEKKEEDISTADGKGIDWIQAAREAVFSKGQSKRIWNELYKVPYIILLSLTSGHRFFRHSHKCSGCSGSYGNEVSGRRTTSSERGTTQTSNFPPK